MAEADPDDPLPLPVEVATTSEDPVASGRAPVPTMSVLPGTPLAGERPRPRVALVLGSGGARGYAHIGVVQVLAERGAEVTAIAGTSMGALVGGLLASGRLDDYAEWATGLSRSKVLRLLDLSINAPGAVRGNKVFRVMSELLGDAAIEDLPVPFTAVAVDLLAQREVWFQRGPLDVAIRASSAIPSLFTPITLNGRVLVDGGLLDPVPVAPVTAARADHVVAVSLNGSGALPELPVAESAEEEDEAVWSDRLRSTAARWFDRDLLASVRRRRVVNGSEGDGPPRGDPDVAHALGDETEMATADGPALGGSPAQRQRRAPEAGERHDPDDLSTMNVAQLSYEAMQAALTRHRLAVYPPDVLIEVPRNAARTLDFHRAGELIALGRRLAEEALADALPPDP